VTELSPDDRALLDGILRRVRRFDETLGRYYSEGLWMRMDRLYHGFTDFKRSLQGVYGAAREDLYRDARKEFGHELRIPYAFAIVETVLPALLSNRPRILVLPQDGQSERNVQNMKATIDAQQERIDLELKLQAVVKSGLMYGLGVGKSYWLRQEGQKPVVSELSRLHPARMLMRRRAAHAALSTAWSRSRARCSTIRRSSRSRSATSAGTRSARRSRTAVARGIGRGATPGT
jgi:hypothetical protein